MVCLVSLRGDGWMTYFHAVVDQFDYTFPENGLQAFKNGVEFHSMEFKTYLSEDQIKELVNFILHYIADLDIPVKRYEGLLFDHFQ